MIAIVILGIGLVMVATMFPVAWDRARDMGEYTTQAAMIEAAHETVKLVTHVNRGAPYVNDSSLDPSITPIYGSFAGDLVYTSDFTPQAPVDPRILAVSDTRVHQLYLENVTVAGSTPRAFVPKRNEPWGDDNAPWRQEGMGISPGLIPPNVIELGNLVMTYCPPSNTMKSVCDWMFVSPQVRFETRVYPPMDPRPDISDEGEFNDTDPKARLWDDAFDAIHFAWAAFSKLEEQTGTPAPGSGLTIAQADEAVRGGRSFRMYYVALRRPQPTLRYVRQDAGVDYIPDPNNREEVVVPHALPSEEDVLLPVPWRVQIRFPDTVAPENARTGIPTVVEVNTATVPTAEFVTDIFPVGAMFIDEVNGQIFTVAKRRVAGAKLDEVYLTLDREVVIEDIDDGTSIPGMAGDLIIEPEEQIRAVWVFPPPVDSLRGEDDAPVFVGKQPVIDIETKVLKFPPS